MASFWRASTAPIAVPNDPPPKTTTLCVRSSAGGSAPSSPAAALQLVRDHRINESQDAEIWDVSAGGYSLPPPPARGPLLGLARGFGGGAEGPGVEAEGVGAAGAGLDVHGGKEVFQ